MKKCLLPLLAMLIWVSDARAQTHFDPRSHTPLDRVIALCATEPGSARFDRAWLDWLADNPEADLEGAVETVVSRSGTVRSMAIPGMQVKPRAPKPDPEAIAERMFSLAKRPRSR